MDGLDLSGVRDAVSDLLADEIRFTRESDAAAQVDQETGALTRPEPDNVWTGYAAILELDGADEGDPDTQAAVRDLGATHRAMIALTAEDFPVQNGDQLEVVDLSPTTLDRSLADRAWTVVSQTSGGTFGVVRFVYLTED